VLSRKTVSWQTQQWSATKLYAIKKRKLSDKVVDCRRRKTEAKEECRELEQSNPTLAATDLSPVFRIQ
jgi:hypothetical protein